MELAPGSRLGPYEITAPLGAGGMGEVFRARDTRLDRSVAIKVLPAEFTGNETRRIRFEREAKTISQLNHPHICTLYDVGDGFIVMELIEGESLADRLARGPLPLADALKYGAQIADALDRAHRAGVIHRDLKPGNVMITRSGAKLLDFGLAKAAQPVSDLGETTASMPITTEGTILGTFQYMAPEQIEGAAVDARTDIFAFGALLYEMLTGQRAFAGKTKASLIAAIVGGQPRPLTELAPLSPPALEHVIARCLEKDPEDRWQSARDLAEQLRWISATPSTTPTRSSTRGTRIALAALALMLLAAIATIALLALRRPEPLRVETTIPFDENRGLDFWSGPPAFSPDGRSIAYSARDREGRRMIWVRPLESRVARSIPGTDDGMCPFWSPDGTEIGFFAGTQLKKIASTGGQAEVLAAGTPAAGGTWGPNGIILFSPGTTAPIARISAGGGDVTFVTKKKPGEESHRWPSFLPGGKQFIYLAQGADGADNVMFVASIDGKETRKIGPARAKPLFVDGVLLFVRDKVLRAQRFDPAKGALEGDPSTIGEVETGGWAGSAAYTASRDSIVYRGRGRVERAQLVVKDRTGKLVRDLGQPGLWSPNVSPDGRQFVVESLGDIWILGEEGRTRMTFDPRQESWPVWAPDGRSFVYYLRDRGAKIMRQSIDGGKPETVFADPGGEIMVTHWSPDGNYLALARVGSGENRIGFDVLAWSLRERKFIEVSSATESSEASPQFSPDGKWIAYESTESGRWEIFVQPFPPTGAKYQVSSDGGRSPRWPHAGEILFLSPAGRLMSVDVQSSPQFRTGAAQTLFQTDLPERWTPQYAVLPDGNFLLNELIPAEPRPLTLVLNWHKRLAARGAPASGR